MSCAYLHPIPKKYYRDSVSRDYGLFMHGKINLFPINDVPLVFHHQFQRPILVVHSTQQWQCRGSIDKEGLPAICNSNTEKSSETLPTDEGSS